MSEEHERIEELLAGYALGSLSGADAEEAEELLAEHVPTCLTCRRLLEDFRGLTGDLALAPSPQSAPEAVLASLRDDLAHEGLASRRRSLPAWVGAAAVVAVVAMGGLSLILAQRVTDAEGGLTAAENAIQFISDPAAQVVPMQQEDTTDGEAQVAWKPGEAGCYIMVSRLPRPHRHHEYQVWMARDGKAVELAGTFLHKRPSTVLWMTIDVTEYDEIWITDGQEGTEVPPARPLLTAALPSPTA